MSIKQNGGVFGRNPTFNDVTIEGDLIINGEVFTGLDFQGSWNASTNTPALASSTGTNGEFYIVSVAGSTDLNGITNWGIGDWAIFNGTAWQRVEGGADGNFNDLTAKNLTVSDTGVPEIRIEDTDGTNTKTLIKHSNGTTQLLSQNGASHGTTLFQTYNGSDTIQRQRIASNGDISFYDTTGTDAKFVWDASAESLTVDQRIKVGSTADGIALQIDTGVGSILGVDTAGNGWNDLDIRAGSATQLYLDTSGNVGIGTSSPSNKLEVYGGDLRITDNYPAISLKDSDLVTTYGEIGGGSGNLTFDSDLANNAANSYMKFGVDGSERMRIDSSGRVGIGTSSPTASLSLANGTNDSNGIKMQATGWPYYARSGINGTTGAQFIRSTNWNANSNSVDSSGHATTAIIQDTSSGNIKFSTGTTNTVPAEAMRIDASQNVLIAGITTDPQLTTNPGVVISEDAYVGIGRANNVCLFLNRQGSDGEAAVFRRDGGTKGSISVTGSATAYNTSSDYRLKEDWQPMSGATDRLKELKPVNFAWKVDGSRVDGFLAHEAQEVVPESVTGSKDAMMTEEYEVSPATGDIYTPEVVAVEGVEAVDYVAPVEAQEAVMGERQKMETVETGTYVNLSGETITETQEVGVTEDVVQTVVERQDIDGVITEVEVEKTVSVPVMESYEVSPAVEAVEGVEAVEAVEAVEGVAEVIHSANVEQPSELEDGQLWRETTAQVMGEREVPDYQGIDQAKLVPLLVATIQELEARITALES